MNYIYYFYKITNLINQKYYYGVHKQDVNKPDRYMGSGYVLKKAIKKYGIKNFSKEIIKYFNCEHDMYKYEREIVSREFINLHSDECYNVVIGGNECPMSNKHHSVDIKNRIKESCKKTHDRLKKQYTETGIYPNSLKWIEKQRGYNNPDFVKRWQPLYEEYKDLFIELELHSNLPDNVIKQCLFKTQNVKIPNLLKYYIYKQYLSPIKQIVYVKDYISDNYNSKMRCSTANIRKTLFDNTKIKYEFIFKHDEFFNKLKKVIELSLDMNISDSMILQNTLNNNDLYIPEYKTIIDYFLRLGIIYNVRQIQIKGKGLQRNRIAKKTVFDVDFKRINKLLIDKEFNTYELNDNGKLIQKGKFELEINGRKYSLRYK